MSVSLSLHPKVDDPEADISGVLALPRGLASIGDPLEACSFLEAMKIDGGRLRELLVAYGPEQMRNFSSFEQTRIMNMRTDGFILHDHEIQEIFDVVSNALSVIGVYSNQSSADADSLDKTLFCLGAIKTMCDEAKIQNLWLHLSY